ncbi:MAG: ribonuclease HI [Deltaproteobacteria bacterium]|nr:ribonuclease HI [Deltaproteobacteria bacterium]
MLLRFTGGPTEGVFTDGACSGNPGPGGWGMVWVRNNEVVAQDHGHDPQTTNNRMELTALIAAYRTLPADVETTVWTDSELCVKTFTEWVEGWRRNGWRRKAGPIKNLELIQELYALVQAHPKVSLRWIKAHDGARWNEYADSLATAYLRKEL